MIHEATRTLVKSPPEVWEQCSDPESLSRHLNGSFGEIRITRLDPENTVAWEGENGSGTVTIEPSAWGTRVTLTAHTDGEEPEAVEIPEPEVPEPAVEPPQPAPPPPPRQSMMQLILRLWRRRTAADPVPGVDPPPTAWPGPAPAEPEPEPVVPPEPDGSAILMAALESMGQAHHRPYSRG